MRAARLRAPGAWPSREVRLPTRGQLAAALPAVVAACILFRGAVFEGRAFFQRDVHLMWYAQVEAAVRAVAGGSLPLWNPLIGFGQPLWADANNQLLYPMTWLHLVLRPWTYYTLFVVGHTLLSAWGTVLLGRRVGLSNPAAIAAAVVWTAVGPHVSIVDMWNQFAGAAWIPWAALAADRALSSGQVGAALAWGGVVAAQVLAGSPEMAVAGALLAAGHAAARRRSGAARPAPALRAVGIAVLFALALSAGQWLPSVLAARHSARRSLPVEVRTYWSVHPAALVQALWPVRLDALPLAAGPRASLFESREPLIPSLYLGSAALGLAAAALAGPKRPLRGTYALLAVAFTLLALGRHTPVYGAVIALFPPLGALRYPVKAMVPAAFCWSMLAGMGVDGWGASSTSRRRWIAGVAAPVAIVGIVGTAAAWSLRLGRPPWPDAFDAEAASSWASALQMASRPLWPAAVLALAVAILALLRHRVGPRWTSLAAATLAASDLLYAHASLNPTAPPTLFKTRPPALDELSGPSARLYAYDYFFSGKSLHYLGRSVPYSVARAPGGWPLAAAQALGMRLYLFPPTAAPWGVAGSYDRDVPGLSSTEMALLTDLMRLVEGTPSHLRLLQLGGVTDVVALHARGLEALTLVSEVAGLFPEPIRVYRVPDPLPRTWVVAGRRAADGVAALEALLDPGFDPRREVLLPSGPTVSAPVMSAGSSRLVQHGPNHVAIEALLDTPGYVVLADAWAPGWTARVDGAPSPLLRANVAFRAVPVPAGRHRIEQVYEPPGLVPGLALSAAAVVAVVGRVLVRRTPAVPAPHA